MWLFNAKSVMHNFAEKFAFNTINHWLKTALNKLCINNFFIFFLILTLCSTLSKDERRDRQSRRNAKYIQKMCFSWLRKITPLFIQTPIARISQMCAAAAAAVVPLEAPKPWMNYDDRIRFCCTYHTIVPTIKDPTKKFYI